MLRNTGYERPSLPSVEAPWARRGRRGDTGIFEPRRAKISPLGYQQLSYLHETGTVRQLDTDGPRLCDCAHHSSMGRNIYREMIGASLFHLADIGLITPLSLAGNFEVEQ